MSDSWPDRLDELEPTGSDADVIDELRTADPDEIPPTAQVSDDIEVDPADSWEQAQPAGGGFDDHDR
jgi:hypothetical protein